MIIKQGVIVMVWITVIITLVSGIKYIMKAGPVIMAK
jgi:CDP-diacylglycerol--glycerol-3-phosphate 3-phosphatidyltransferase